MAFGKPTVKSTGKATYSAPKIQPAAVNPYSSPAAQALKKRLASAPQNAAGVPGAPAAAAPAAVGAPSPALASYNPYSFAAQNSLDGIDAAMQAEIAKIAGLGDTAKARYGAGLDGKIDWENPVDPFSVSGAMKTLFRQAQDAQRYGQASAGTLYDGSSALESALQQQGQMQDRRTKQDELGDYLAGLETQAGGIRTNAATSKAGILAQLAQAWADDPNNNLGEPGAAAAGGAAGGAVAAAGPARYSGPTGLQGNRYIDSQGGVHATKQVGSRKYYLTGSGQWQQI